MSRLLGFGKMVRKICFSIANFVLKPVSIWCRTIVNRASTEYPHPLFNREPPPPLLQYVTENPHPRFLVEPSICNAISPRRRIAGVRWQKLNCSVSNFCTDWQRHIYIFISLTWRVFPLHQSCWYLWLKSVTRSPWSQRHRKYWIE